MAASFWCPVGWHALSSKLIGVLCWYIGVAFLMLCTWLSTACSLWSESQHQHLAKLIQLFKGPTVLIKTEGFLFFVCQTGIDSVFDWHVPLSISSFYRRRLRDGLCLQLNQTKPKQTPLIQFNSEYDIINKKFQSWIVLARALPRGFHLLFHSSALCTDEQQMHHWLWEIRALVIPPSRDGSSSSVQCLYLYCIFILNKKAQLKLHERNLTQASDQLLVLFVLSVQQTGTDQLEEQACSAFWNRLQGPGRLSLPAMLFSCTLSEVSMTVCSVTVISLKSIITVFMVSSSLKAE